MFNLDYSINNGKNYRFKGNQVGKIYGDYLYARRNSSRDMILKPYGWPFSRDLLQDLKKKWIHYVLIEDEDQGVVFYTTLDKIFKHGERFDWGYGVQISLHLDYWIVLPGDFLPQMDKGYGR